MTFNCHLCNQAGVGSLTNVLGYVIMGTGVKMNGTLGGDEMHIKHEHIQCRLIAIVALVESRIGVIASDSVELHYGGLDSVRAVLDELEAHINATRTFIAECEMGIKHEL